MSERDGRGGNRYVFGGLGIGHHESRHEAIGYAAIFGRKGVCKPPFERPESAEATKENIMHSMSRITAYDRGEAL